MLKGDYSKQLFAAWHCKSYPPYISTPQMEEASRGPVPPELPCDPKEAPQPPPEPTLAPLQGCQGVPLGPQAGRCWQTLRPCPGRHKHLAVTYSFLGHCLLRFLKSLWK